MNTPLRRVALAVILMVIALLGNATYVQIFKADTLRADPRNQRVLFDEYSRQRGQITAGGQVMASSVTTDNRYKFLRQYPNPFVDAPITGYYSIQYSSAGIERAEDSILNGSDNTLFGRRLIDLVSGRDPRGGSVQTTIDPILQQVAYDQLLDRGYTGSVVAIEPATGKILAMVSTPSYDPNPLASHNAEVRTNAWEALQNDPGEPMLNRAIAQTYPPGSTFKVITAAAALSSGSRVTDQLTAAPRIQLPGTTTTLENYNGTNCGNEPTVSLTEAFARSCNTAFVELGIKAGAQSIKDTAAAFGIDSEPSKIPLPLVGSTVGALTDDAAIGQSSIGQLNVALTPLQNAVIAATIANGGMRMKPYLINNLQGPDLTNLSTTQPTPLGQAVTAEVASKLTALMTASENNTVNSGSIAGLQIASKTGTAEHGLDPRNTPPHAWYIGFAPASNAKIAVAVIVENGGDRALAATGGSVAAPIGRAVIAASLRGNP
ncbi:MAG: peptidoglycan D,D-transpeptidase FtsI family protein [Mycobacteriaceae bacterium]